MDKLSITRETSPAAAAAAAGEALNNLLMEHRDRALLLLLSGGSALELLDYVNAKNTGSHLTVAMLDERFSQDKAINNFSQMQRTDFYSRALETETNFFGSLPRNGESKEQLALRLETNLKAWRQHNPNGLILATLGLGADGHTAGIFPFPEDTVLFEELFNGSQWVVAYDAGDKTPYRERITATFPLLEQIDYGLAYACGEEKKPKLQQIMARSSKPARLPALAWYRIKQLQIFTDLE